jgi:hypothetical protein
MQSMETLRIITRSPEPTAWAKAFWPLVAVAVAAMLDQSTRGPSITAMLLTNLLN